MINNNNDICTQNTNSPVDINSRNNTTHKLNTKLYYSCSLNEPDSPFQAITRWVQGKPSEEGLQELTDGIREVSLTPAPSNSRASSPAPPTQRLPTTATSRPIWISGCKPPLPPLDLSCPSCQPNEEESPRVKNKKISRQRATVMRKKSEQPAVVVLGKKVRMPAHQGDSEGWIVNEKNSEQLQGVAQVGESEGWIVIVEESDDSKVVVVVEGENRQDVLEVEDKPVTERKKNKGRLVIEEVKCEEEEGGMVTEGQVMNESEGLVTITQVEQKLDTEMEKENLESYEAEDNLEREEKMYQKCEGGKKDQKEEVQDDNESTDGDDTEREEEKEVEYIASAPARLPYHSPTSTPVPPRLSNS